MKTRYVEITHKYYAPVPAEAVDLADFDTLCNSAVSQMEDYIRRLNPQVADLRSHWEICPRDLQFGTAHRGRVITPEEAMARGGQVTFVDDVMGGVGGVMHPHEQGVRFFPEGHPLYNAESKVIAEEEETVIEAEDAKLLEPGEE